MCASPENGIDRPRGLSPHAVAEAAMPDAIACDMWVQLFKTVAIMGLEDSESSLPIRRANKGHLQIENKP